MPASSAAGMTRCRNDSRLCQRSSSVKPSIAVHEGGETLLRIALVPAGQGELARERVHREHLGLVVGQGVRAVRLAQGQRAAQPVEHRHEVVAHAAHAGLAQAADVLAVRFDEARRVRPAELDLFGHGHALHHLEREALRVRLLRDAGDALAAPNLAGLSIVYGGDDARHAGDLPDLLQRDGIAFSVPSECQFHRKLLSPALCRKEGRGVRILQTNRTILLLCYKAEGDAREK